MAACEISYKFVENDPIEVVFAVVALDEFSLYEKLFK